MILDNYLDFLDKLFEKLSEFKIDVSSLELDHFGWQASSDGDYDKLKPEFKRYGPCVHEAIVRGRRVSIFKLNKPFKYRNYTLSAIELYAPVASQVCISALEHAEFVVSEPLGKYMKKYPNLSWDTSAINQEGFPMLKLRLSPNMQVKFHPENILETVKKNN